MLPRIAYNFDSKNGIILVYTTSLHNQCLLIFFFIERKIEDSDLLNTVGHNGGKELSSPY